MNKEQIILQYLQTPWAVSPSMAIAGKLQLAKIIKGEGVAVSDLKAMREELKRKTGVLVAKPTQNGFEVDNGDDLRNSQIPVGSTAIMRINGTITKQGDACSKGVDDYIDELQEIGQNPAFNSLLVEVHSGGGSAFGPEDFAQELSQFEKRYKKPVAALIRSQAASAAYEMIATAPEIFIAGQSSIAGSIGVMMSIYSQQEWLEQQGIKEIIVRATDSFNKNEEYYQALQGNPEPMQKNILDPLNKSFQNIVKKGRRGKLNYSNKIDGVAEPLTGKIYVGNEIIDAGLADGVKTRFEAISYLQKKADDYKDKDKKRKRTRQMFEFQNKTADELKQELEDVSAKIEAAEQGAEATQELEQMQKILQREVEFRALQTQKEQFEQQGKKLEQAQKEIENLKASAEAATETIKQVEQLTAKVEQLQQSADEANEAKAELESNIKQFQDAKAELEAENKAFKSFVAKNYGENQVVAIATGVSQDGKQPEVKPKAGRPMSKKEQHWRNWGEIKSQLTKQVK